MTNATTTARRNLTNATRRAAEAAARAVTARAASDDAIARAAAIEATLPNADADLFAFLDAVRDSGFNEAVAAATEAESVAEAEDICVEAAREAVFCARLALDLELRDAALRARRCA